MNHHLEVENEFNQLTEDHKNIITASNSIDATLLITGCTGTGKSQLAWNAHCFSPQRRLHRFTKINLATLSENLIESELFGHEKGSFTGADSRRIGRIELSQGGTVFLDEIGELSPRLQAKLLDFIQYKKISPVGSNRDIEVDVRIIAATNRNLEQSVEKGEFRADLFHRLRVFHIELQNISENPNKLISIARSILNKKSSTAQKCIRCFSSEVERVFLNYDWPGNIRELENAIEFSVGMETTTEISSRSLPQHLRKVELSSKTNPVHASNDPNNSSEFDQATRIELPINWNFYESLEVFERIYLENALRMYKGQINLTSKRIGLNKVSLSGKIRKHSIDWKKFRAPPRMKETKIASLLSH